MRIAIVSDTHKRWEPVARAIKAEEKMDYLLFLGDHAEDGHLLAKELAIPHAIVQGNCDYSGIDGMEKILDLEGIKIFICHGHVYQVKEKLDTLIYHGKEVGADVVCFGHTHIAMDIEQDDIRLINPGTAGKPHILEKNGSWGILEIQTCQENHKKTIKYEKKILPL